MLGHHREDVVEVMGQLGGSGLLPGVQRQQRRRRWHTAFGALAPPTHPTLDVIAAERFGTLKKIIIKKGNNARSDSSNATTELENE